MGAFDSNELSAAKEVSLCEVARACGYTPFRVGRCMSLKEMDSIRIYNDKTYYRFSSGSGGSQIDFVMEFMDMTMPEAVEWLNGLSVMTIVKHPASAPSAKPKKDLVFPIPNTANQYLYHYLTQERYLSKETIEWYVKEGLIFEEAGTHNICFLGKNDEDVVKQVFKRGTYDYHGLPSKFKCEADGSDKEHFAFLSKGENKEIYVFEAAIDLMSFSQLNGDFFSTKMALGMLADLPLEHFLLSHSETKQICLCMDNDVPGKKAAERIKEKYQEKGYIVSQYSFSEECKDINDYLKSKSQKKENKTMELSIKTYEIEGSENNLKGFADVTFADSFVVKGIKIIEGSNGLYCSMPNYRTSKVDPDGNFIYKDIFHPITKECHDVLNEAITKSFTSKENVEVTLEPEFDFQVTVTPFEKGALAGLASINLGKSFVINDVRIITGQKGNFIAMPSQKTGQLTSEGKDVYRDMCFPITKDFRDELYSTITSKYVEVRDKSREPEEQKQEKSTDKKEDVEGEKEKTR